MSPKLAAIKRMFGNKLAPNGLPIHENFAKWFGDSKVVDKKGKPLVVYHGTASEFNAFDPAKVGSTFEVDDYGFHFISNQETADKYADAARVVAKRRGQIGKARTIPAYLSMQNPWIIYVDTNKETGKSPIAHFESGNGVFNRGQQNIIQYAIDSGYDGLIIRDERGVDADHEALFIAFNPNKIKSATDNNGNFDPSSPHLTDDQNMLSATDQHDDAQIEEERERMRA